MRGFQLTNYWLLLIYVLIAAIIVYNFCVLHPVRINGVIKYRYSLLIAVICAVPLIIWTAYRPNSIGDTYAYRIGFLERETGIDAIIQTWNTTEKDRGFYAFEALLKTIIGNNDILFFGIIATVQILCVLLVFRKYSEDFILCLFLFIASTDYVSWAWNGMRQFLAASILFACIGLMIKRKVIPVIIIVCLLSLIHGSILIMIPIFLVCIGQAWNKRTLLFILLVILSVIYVGEATSLLDFATENTQYEGIVHDSIWLQDDGTNPLRALVYSMPAILSIFGRRYIRDNQDPTVHLCVNMSIMSAGIYVISIVTSGILIGRLPIYMSMFSYISLVWLLNHMFEKGSRIIIKGIMILLYVVFFYYQMTSWGLSM